jgi:hypothetical protein
MCCILTVIRCLELCQKRKNLYVGSGRSFVITSDNIKSQAN